MPAATGKAADPAAQRPRKDASQPRGSAVSPAPFDRARGIRVDAGRCGHRVGHVLEQVLHPAAEVFDGAKRMR
jgi:hypothetical protein